MCHPSLPIWARNFDRILASQFHVGGRKAANGEVACFKPSVRIIILDWGGFGGVARFELFSFFFFFPAASPDSGFAQASFSGGPEFFSGNILLK